MSKRKAKATYDSNGTMLAAVLHAFNDLRLEQVPKPQAKLPGEVVVQIRSCGICQTDYKAIKGIRKNVTFPSIHGHESSGVVVQTGPGVTHFAVGDHVIVSPLSYCGFCEACRMGKHHHCEHAAVYGGDGPDDFRPGSFAECLLTQECCLYMKPPEISWDAAAVTEPLAGAWKGTIEHSQVQLGEDVVVIGVGGIGLLCLMVARAAGAANVIAVDVSEHARKNALACGATHAIDPSVGDAYKAVYDVIPKGPDVIIEAAGAIKAVELMVKLRRRGTRWNVFGITTKEQFSLEGGQTHWLEGRQDASFGSHPLSFIQAIKLMQSKLVDTERIISHRFALTEIDKAIACMASPDRNKVVVVVSKD